MFVKLEGRLVLMVGAGPVGEGKIESLLAAGASVRVVSPQATPRVREWAREGRIEWEAREYKPSDFAGAFLVIAATGSTAVHDEIYAEAKSRGVLCNAVDEPERCDFYFPAVVRRGDLQIAISTGGLSPALASWLRDRLAASCGPGLGDLAALLAEARARLRSEGARSDAVDWVALLNGPLPALVRSGDLEDARAIVASATTTSGQELPPS